MTITLDFYLICIILSIAALLFTSFVLFALKKKRNKKGNITLGIALMFLALSFLSDVLNKTKFFLSFPHLMDYDNFLTLCIGPLIALYILYNTRPDFKIKPIHSVHLVALLFFFILKIEFFTSSAVKKIQIIENEDWLNIPHQLAGFRFVVFQLFLYIFICFALLKRHRRIIKQLMSTIKRKELTWLRQFLWAILILALTWATSNEIFFNYQINFAPVLGAFLVVFTYWMGYKSINQENIYQNINVEDVLPIIEENPGSRYQNSTLKPEDIDLLKAQVEEVMKSSRPYLKSNLTLTNLSEEVQINSKHLSQVLNEGFNENFYKFINRYRIEEAKLLLQNSIAQFNILGIALESGFNSKSTFNKSFKEHTGCSPSEYAQKEKS